MKTKLLVATLVISSSLMVAATVGLVYARLFVFNYSIVPQNGMYPGLPSGSRVLSWRGPYRNADEVKRGDVVLFTGSLDGETHKFIWRVVGLPGDEVRIDGQSLWINGQQVQHERLRQDGELIIYRETIGPASYEVAYPQNYNPTDEPGVLIKVPANFFYVLGDNRANALDSRFTGPVAFASIYGKKV